MRIPEVSSMSEPRSTSALFLVTILFAAVFMPILAPAASASAEPEEVEAYSAGGTVIGDLADFDPSEGREYIMIEEEMPVVSAFSFLKNAWIEEGRPGAEEMVIAPQTSARAAGRACNPHVVNDQLTVPTSGG